MTADEQKIQIIEIAELPKIIHAYQSGDGRGWDENAWAHPISCTIAEYHRADIAPSPAINQELAEALRFYSSKGRNSTNYVTDLGATADAALEKHAAAVKRGESI